ncbi:DUF922 domain-containing protein [Croceiramulus getboli]|nr:DUF922 domain-containing protein [Flavobacteriaceae bacterium YJPT1-3]
MRLFLWLAFISGGALTAQERIAWDAYRPLNWSDFQGIADRQVAYVANTASGISHSYEIDQRGFFRKESSVVTANFYPQYSWYKRNRVNAQVLAHERVHFDISEVFARKFRKRIAQFSFSSRSQQEIKQLYQRIERERQQAQADYDRDTQHSINPAQEALWRQKVQLWLREYQDFAR